MHLSEQGRHNLKMALEQIEKATGVKVVDFSNAPDYHVNWFLDTDHLTLFGGRVRFSKQLADYYDRNHLPRGGVLYLNQITHTSVDILNSQSKAIATLNTGSLRYVDLKLQEHFLREKSAQLPDVALLSHRSITTKP